MDEETSNCRIWIRVGIYAGLGVSIVYPLMIFVPLSKKITIILASLFGPLLMLASLGLYYFLKAHRKTVTGQIAVLSNIIASALVTLMLIVQLSVNFSMDRLMASTGGEMSEQAMKWIWQVIDKVQLGMDVSWDIFISVGTILFGVTMMRHPRFGKVIGSLGFLIGLFLLVFNLATFPAPPGDSGLIDLGPVLGIWYLVVTILIIRSLKWFDQQFA